MLLGQMLFVTESPKRRVTSWNRMEPWQPGSQISLGHLGCQNSWGWIEIQLYNQLRER